MEDHLQTLSLPLLSDTDTDTGSSPVTGPASPNESSSLSSNYGVAVRLLLIAFIGLTSLWANHEASKGFDITIVNDAKGSPAGQRFDLFYVSNDEATRMVLNASKFVEDLIYPSDVFPKKEVKSVHLRLVPRDLSRNVAVEKLDTGVDFFINISPSIFQERNFHHAMAAAVLRGMSRIWLWDGQSEAPPSLVAGMVEHISTVAGFVESKHSGGRVVSRVSACEPMWWKYKDPTMVAVYLNYHERHRKGFIPQLNQVLKSRWQDRTVEDALGMPCNSLNSSEIRV